MTFRPQALRQEHGHTGQKLHRLCGQRYGVAGELCYRCDEAMVVTSS